MDLDRLRGSSFLCRVRALSGLLVRLLRRPASGGGEPARPLFLSPSVFPFPPTKLLFPVVFPVAPFASSEAPLPPSLASPRAGPFATSTSTTIPSRGLGAGSSTTLDRATVLVPGPFFLSHYVSFLRFPHVPLFSTTLRPPLSSSSTTILLCILSFLFMFASWTLSAQPRARRTPVYLPLLSPFSAPRRSRGSKTSI